MPSQISMDALFSLCVVLKTNREGDGRSRACGFVMVYVLDAGLSRRICTE